MNDGSSTRPAAPLPPARTRFNRAGLAIVAASLFWLLLFSLTASAATNAVAKLANSDCLDCHTDPSNTRTVNGQKVPLAVFPTNSFARSVHSMLDCTDCHTGVKELVHSANLPPPDCTGCHDKEAKDYATSIHGMSHSMGASGAAQCWDCHGSHEILPVKNPIVAGLQNEPAGDLRQVPQQHQSHQGIPD